MAKQSEEVADQKAQVYCKCSQKEQQRTQQEVELYSLPKVGDRASPAVEPSDLKTEQQKREETLHKKKTWLMNKKQTVSCYREIQSRHLPLLYCKTHTPSLETKYCSFYAETVEPVSD